MISTSKMRPTSSPRLLFKQLARLRFIITASLFIAALVTSLAFVYDRIQAAPNQRLENLVPVDLEDIHRLLVIAPHPDDETLGAAGLIQAVLQKGGLVRVVIVTNGDAQAIGPLLADRAPLPLPANYIKFGYRRQQETRKALSALGVPEDMISFLGYPDGALKQLWESNWEQSQPISGKFTRVRANPYDQSYHKQSSYRGSDLLQDLTEILDAFQPDLIVVPHPEDAHEDHRASSNFSRFAAALYQSQTAKPLQIWGYLVHYEEYPSPRGANVHKSLLPPAALSRNGEEWLSYPLSDRQFVKKHLALHAYTSQLKIMGKYLRSFVCANEIFYRLPSIDLPWLAIEDGRVMEEGLQFSSIVNEPVRERFSRFVVASADLTAWKALRLGDRVCFAAKTRGTLRNEINYRILLKLPDGTTLYTPRDEDLPLMPEDVFGACFNLDDLGHPSVIGFSAEARRGVLLDYTAWHFVILSNQE